MIFFSFLKTLSGKLVLGLWKILRVLGIFCEASKRGWEHHAILNSRKLLFVAHFSKVCVKWFGTVWYTKALDKAWLFSGLLEMQCSLGVHVTQLFDSELLQSWFSHITLLGWEYGISYPLHFGISLAWGFSLLC